jgi:hypothetical protein
MRSKYTVPFKIIKADAALQPAGLNMSNPGCKPGAEACAPPLHPTPQGSNNPAQGIRPGSRGDVGNIILYI